MLTLSTGDINHPCGPMVLRIYTALSHAAKCCVPSARGSGISMEFLEDDKRCNNASHTVFDIVTPSLPAADLEVIVAELSAIQGIIQ